MVLFTFEGLIIVGHKACTYPFLILYLAEIGSSYISWIIIRKDYYRSQIALVGTGG